MTGAASMLSKLSSSRLRASPSISSTENSCTVLAVNCLSFVVRHARSIEISVVSLSASNSTRPFSPSVQISSKFFDARRRRNHVAPLPRRRGTSSPGLEFNQPARRAAIERHRAVLDQRLLEARNQPAARRHREAFESLVVAQSGLAVAGDLKFLRILDHVGDDAVVRSSAATPAATRRRRARDLLRP